jgi:membrane protein DedA with SNARE-associated domain
MLSSEAIATRVAGQRGRATDMQTAFMEFIQQFGYLAVGALIFLENVFPPIPSEVILPLSGFFARSGAMALPLTILVATAGSLVGAYALYAVGTVLNRERLMRLLATKPARLLGFSSGDVDAAFGWFERRGPVTVLACRCVPVVRSLISIPAGMARMGLASFTLMTVLGSLVWNAVLCTLGFWAGGAWESVASGAASVINIVTYALVAVAAVVACVWFVRRVVPAIRGVRGE